MSQCFLGKESTPEDMKMEQVRVIFQKVWRIYNLYRSMYFEALDIVVCGIKERFDQAGYKVHSNFKGCVSQSSQEG